MEVKNCRACGRLFNYMGAGSSKICPACSELLENTFQNVKRYIEENPGVNMDTVCKECEVSQKQVTQWIREERLTFASGSAITVECEMCGAAIRSGRFCDKCRNDMAKGLTNAFRKEAPAIKKTERDGNRMRFLDK